MLSPGPLYSANFQEFEIYFSSNHLHTIPNPRIRARKQLEACISGTRCGTIIVDDVGMFVMANTKQRPPLMFNLPSIALLRISRADRVLLTLCGLHHILGCQWME